MLATAPTKEMTIAQLKQMCRDRKVKGFSGKNKFVYQILAELDEDQSGGIDFDEFLKLATKYNLKYYDDVKPVQDYTIWYASCY